MGGANGQTSPLVLDLAATGINLTALSYESPYFDLTGSGFATKTGWIGAGTGLLCLDPGGDSQINSGLELFGTAGGAANGFAALAQLDSNGDGIIDSSDTAFANLRVWVDSNGNGVVDPGELFTLPELGIVSISLDATSVDQTIAGNSIKLTSTFTLTDGSQQTIADAWFATSPTYTKPDVAVSIPSDIAALPQVNGYGTMVDLQSAMTTDSTLASLVETFQTLSSSTDPATLKSDVQAIMYEWAGVSNLNPTSRGNFVDARQLAFAEKYTGVSFSNGNPAVSQSVDTNQAWNDVFDGVLARLVLQTGLAAEVPEFTYNLAADFVLPAIDLATSFADAYTRLSAITAANFDQWDLVFRVADAFRLDSHLSMTQYLWTIAAATSDTIASVANAISTDIAVSFAANGSIVETGTNLGSDFYAGPGVSELVGNKAGVFAKVTESFYFNPGDGTLTISELDDIVNHNDILNLGSGITTAAVTVTGDAFGNIILTIGTNGDKIIIDNMNSDGDTQSWFGVQTVQFADRTTWSAAQVLAMAATGTPGNDDLYGGYATETFDGKGGNDYAQGGANGDSFVFDPGYGHLEIHEFGVYGSINTLNFGAGIAPSQITVTGDANGDLFVADGISGDQVKIDEVLASFDYGIQDVQFSDGTTWDLSQLIALETTGTPGPDSLYGSAAAETFDGKGGGDYEQGGGGGDTFIYDPGYGQLTIFEEDFSTTPSNVLQFGSGILPSQIVVIGDGSGNITLTDGTAGDQVIVDNQLNAPVYGVDGVRFADGTTWTRQQLVLAETTGTPGPDHLYGTPGAEVFDGKGGNDYEQGGGGGDTFVYDPGYGQLTIFEEDFNTAANDALQFGSGILPSQIVVIGDVSGNITLTDGTAGDQVIVDSQLNAPYYGIDGVRFADGTTWTRQQLILAETTGTPGPDHLYGTPGADVFDGKGGGDYEQGGGGGDTFIYDQGYGQLEISETDLSSAADDVLQFGAGITPSQIVVTDDGSGNLLLADGTSGDQVLIVGELYSPYYGVDGVQFADGTTWTRAELIADDSTGSGGGGGSGNDGYVLDAGDGHVTVTADASSGPYVLSVGFAPADVVLQADAGGDLTVALRDDSSDSITFDGDLAGNWWGASSVISQIDFSGGTTLAVGQPGYGYGQGITFTWLATASDTTLSGSGYGANVFDLGAGGDAVTFGNGSEGGSSYNSILFGAGDGAATVNPNGSAGTVTLGAGIAASDVVFQADGAGDLTVGLRDDAADHITVAGDLASHWWGASSQISQIDFADGTTLAVGQPSYGYGQGITFTWLGTASDTTLTGSGYGANVFDLRAGGDAVTFGNGSGGGSAYNSVLFDEGDGVATVNVNGSTGTLTLGADIAAADVIFQTDAGGDLTVALRDDSSDSIVFAGDLAGHWWGASSQLSQINFANGTTLAVGQPSYGYGQGITFTWVGTASETTLTGSGYGANVFDLGPGGDAVTFGNGSGGGSTYNSVLFDEGDGAATVNVNGSTGTLSLGADISASDVIFQADASGDLTVGLRDDPGDSITFNGDLASHWWGASSQLSQINFADGSTLAVGQPSYGYGQGITFTSVGSASDTTLTGSGYGANVFDLGPGGDTVTFGNGSEGGSTFNSVLFDEGDGAATINENGSTGTLTLGADIAASDVILQADTVGDLTVALRDDVSDKMTFLGDLASNWWGTSSKLSRINFGDGTTLAVGQPSNGYGQGIDFTWIGSDGGTLSASDFGSNTFDFRDGVFGSNEIDSFDVSRDIVQFGTAAFTSFSDLESNVTSASGGALITVAGTGSVLLAGVDPSQLQARDFQFG